MVAMACTAARCNTSTKTNSAPTTRMLQSHSNRELQFASVSILFVSFLILSLLIDCVSLIYVLQTNASDLCTCTQCLCCLFGSIFTYLQTEQYKLLCSQSAHKVRILLMTHRIVAAL